MKLFIIVLFSFLVCQGYSGKLCYKTQPRFNTNSFGISQPIVSEKLAKRYLQFPQVIPLLFGNYISNYVKRGSRACDLIKDRNKKITLIFAKKRADAVVFMVLGHHRDSFPVSLKNCRFLVLLSKKRPGRYPTLHIRFRGPHLQQNSRIQRSRNIFARSLVQTMLENARLVLGLGSCSSSLSSITGICNNPFHPTFGITYKKQLHPWRVPTLKISPSLPNPRLISNKLCKARTHVVAPRKVNMLMVVFGQFMDHDLILTPSGETSYRDASFKLPPSDGRTAKMHFLRSDPLPLSPSRCCDTSYSPSEGEWNQFNRITSFIDGSTIYGSDNDRAMALRSFRNGKLILKRRKGGELLPRNSKRDLLFILSNANKHSNEKLFASGDVRANENPVLTALHTLFAREHNRVCNILIRALRSKGSYRQTDEWLYQQARKIVIAEIQNIVYNEFLPAMLGPYPLEPYTGYKSTVDPSMDIMFTTAAYRWGHSAIRNTLQTRSMSNQRKTHRLQDVFFNPDAFSKYDIESWLLGAMDAPASGIDLQHADSVRDFLFNPKRRAVLDLVALNIQRGRDHGLPSYTTARRVYGLSSSGQGLGAIPPSVRAKLLSVYRSSNNIDPFVGGLAETPLVDSLLGPFFHAVVKDQFRRLRDGDRFYYENVNWGSFLKKLRIVEKIMNHDVRLADIIRANTRIEGKHMPSQGNAMQTA